MATPVLTPSVDQPSYAPGAPVVASWTVIDADNSTEELRFEGTDSQGNPASATIQLNRQDLFTMTRVYWVRTGTNLAINNGTRTATGVMPSA